MRGICSFLDIPYDPKVTTLDGADVSSIYPEKHHSGVRRESIHLKPERTFIVPAAIRRKVKRYISEWKAMEGGGWPPYPRYLGHGDERPTFTEKIFDRLAYEILSAYDRFVLLVFGAAPLPALQRYRDAKRFYRELRRNGRFVSKWMPTSLRPSVLALFRADTQPNATDGKMPESRSARTYASGR
jgi:hypothetical protein